MSILNHSCTSNTLCYAKDDFTFACRAVVPIKKGEELTTNYLHYHYHFFGGSYRGVELSDNWYFQCRCDRCQDSSEAGTGADCLVCSVCQGRTMTRTNTFDDTMTSTMTMWECNVCGVKKTNEAVKGMLANYWDLMEKTTDSDVSGLDQLLPKLLKVFHKNHFYILEVKRRIMESLRNYEDLADRMLEKKVEYCRDHLAVQQYLAPGLSEYRAYISQHLAEPLYWLAREKTPDTDVVKTMEEVAHHLLLVIQVWGPFRCGSDERMAAEKARRLLHSVDTQYLHRDLGQQADNVLNNNSLETYNYQQFFKI